MCKKSNLSILLIFFFVACLPMLVYGGNQGVVSDSYSATISWRTDKPSTSQVLFGTNTPYDQKTEQSGQLSTHHTVVLDNLTPSTEYHYKVVSQDAFGNQAESPDLTFSTLGKIAKDQPPQITDIEAAAIIAAGPARPVSTPSERTEGLTDEEQVDILSRTAGQLVKKEAPMEETLINKGGLLLPKGKWQIEPSFNYAHVSANRIAFLGYTIIPVLVVGEISSEEVKRDIFITAMTARYGLRDDLQLEMRVPYRYQHDRVSVGTTSETTRSLHGLGDVEAGIQYQLAHEEGLMPDLIAALGVKSRTGEEPYGQDIGIGTGHWAIKSSLVAVKSSDPVIIFGSLGYTYNVKRNDVTDYGTIEPGNSFDYKLGAAFALNYQFAMSFQIEQIVSEKLYLNHVAVPSSFTNVVNFKYGVTWSISDDFSCDVTASNGLTEDAPNFALEVRFPYTF